jgi:Tfp pilus assembly protein PilN
MIKINLADKKRSDMATNATGGTGGTGTIGGTLGTLTSLTRNFDLASLKELELERALIPLVVGVAATYAVGIYQDNEIKKLNVEIDSINSEKPKLQAAAGKMKTYEDLKKGMEADEFVIRTKLDTIHKLIQGRSDTAKYLEDLAQLTPPAVWLTSFAYNGTDFDIRGSAANFRQISPFLKAMTENPNFQDLTLKDSQTSKDANQRDIVTFELVSGAKR